MKRLCSLILAVSLIIVCPALAAPAQAEQAPLQTVSAAGATLNEKATHISYMDRTGEMDRIYSKDSYLYDTLTLAGSGMGGVSTHTVYDLEYLALNGDLGYENSYSLQTSGGVYSISALTGIPLYKFLIYAGMDATLPDNTQVRAISKDGYTISFTLKALRNDKYSRYTSAAAAGPEETGLPVLLAFGSGGLPLVGPVGDEPVFKSFGPDEGYNSDADNIGGPIRLFFGQTSADEFNAPNCSKWLAAIIIGDADGYVYQQETGETGDISEPEAGGDWRHNGAYPDFTLTITGSEAKKAKLSLNDIENDLSEHVVREYFAASGGRAAYEGIPLKAIIDLYTKDGIDRPSKVVVVSADGYRKALDVNEIYSGIDSRYQPGKHKDILLAYAADGAPLVTDMKSEGYTGANSFGPLRLVVENTISAWVKGVVKIIIGEEEHFTDLAGYEWAEGSINTLFTRGVVTGRGDGKFEPGVSMTRADFVLMVARAYGFANGVPGSGGSGNNFADVTPGSYYYDAVEAAKALGIVKGDGNNFNPGGYITREDAMTLLYRTLDALGMTPPAGGELNFRDAGDVSVYAKDAVAALAAAGIVKGDGEKFNPRANITRAEMAVALCRTLELSGNQ